MRFRPPSAELDQIFAGPQGALWFTELNPNYTDKIGRISTSGRIDECPIPTHASYPEGLAVGPDGNLWYSETGANKIGVLTP